MLTIRASIQPAPTSGKFSRPPGQPLNFPTPSLKPKRAGLGAQRLQGRQRGGPESPPAFRRAAAHPPPFGGHRDARMARPSSRGSWGQQSPVLRPRCALPLQGFPLLSVFLSVASVKVTLHNYDSGDRDTPEEHCQPWGCRAGHSAWCSEAGTAPTTPRPVQVRKLRPKVIQLLRAVS